MARQYGEAVGPWREFLRVVREVDLDSGRTGGSVG
jgi:hypothetical protein